MKKILIILLCTIIFYGAIPAFADEFSADPWTPYQPKKHEVIFSQEMYPVSSIDPSTLNNPKGSFYPGLRGSNQLVIYTPAHGVATGTNEFGAEAIVKGNTVISLSGADSIIPEDGFVISAHGSAKKWLNENVLVGTKIYVDKATKELYTYTTSDSFIFGAQEKIYEADSMISYYECNLLNYNAQVPKSYVSRACFYLKKAKKDPKKVQLFSTLSIENANNAIAQSVPYKENELKGVWIRPDSSSYESIVATLDDLKKTGINNIFLETFFHGKTIFPSSTMKNYGFIDQNELFVGVDPLKIWIEEAHKRNIKVNIWFESFYVGNKPPSSNPNSILAKKPDWANINKRNAPKDVTAAVSPTPSLSEHNGYFLDPANPEVQDFIVCLIKEIIYAYNPDGINIDYIRYPQSVASQYGDYINSNWGYTKFAREEFKTTYGIDPYEITTKDANWDLWTKYRQNKITTLVQRVSKQCRANNILFTAVVFPNKKHAIETKQQNWSDWAQSGLIDGFTPLFLTCDAKTIKQMISDMNHDLCGSRTNIYAGLFVTFMGGAEEDLIRQIHETRKVNLAGVIIFDNAHFGEKYKKMLMSSAFDSSKCNVVVPKKIRYFKSK